MVASKRFHIANVAARVSFADPGTKRGWPWRASCNRGWPLYDASLGSVGDGVPVFAKKVPPTCMGAQVQLWVGVRYTMPVWPHVTRLPRHENFPRHPFEIHIVVEPRQLILLLAQSLVASQPTRPNDVPSTQGFFLLMVCTSDRISSHGMQNNGCGQHEAACSGRIHATCSHARRVRLSQLCISLRT